MRRCPLAFLSLLLTGALPELGCGQSEIVLTGRPDQGGDRAGVLPGDQGASDARSGVDAPPPDAAAAADQLLMAVDRPIPPADSQVVVPDDPQICKPCVDPGDCPAVGDRNYTCIHAWYKNSDGVNIDEYYCTLICDTLACPTNFDCNPLLDADGNLVNLVCMAKPYGVCELLPES